MRCPKCSSELETKTYGRKILVRRCKACFGLFCKPDVLMEMRREWHSEIVLDSGNPKIGIQLNEMGEIDCPECGIQMDRTFDPVQRHIWFESCSQCEGMWFDAGEFSDLKYDTFMDRIRDYLTGTRPGT